LSEQSPASKNDTQRPLSLPPFVSTTHASADRPSAACGRLKSWDPTPPIQHWTTASAPADAGRGVGILGNLTLVGFMLLAVGMAGVAIHQEQRLAPHERQLMERAR
jgi:hypothetical protein